MNILEPNAIVSCQNCGLGPVIGPSGPITGPEGLVIRPLGVEVFTNIEQPHLYGWPKYWRGATPDTPQDAEFYFCGSKCATEYYEKEKK